MNERRRGLGRGLGALIPSTPERYEPTPATSTPPRRPVDVFFPDEERKRQSEPRPYEALLRPITPGPRGQRPAGRAAVSTPAAQTSEATSSVVEPPQPTVAEPVVATGDASAQASTQPASAPATPERLADSEAGPEGSGTGVAVAHPDSHPDLSGQASAEERSPNPGQPGDDADDDEPELVAVPGARLAEVRVDAVRPNPRQPRTAFDEDELAELVHSVREVGVLQPIVVRPLPDEDGAARYELVMGERRWRACREAGLETMPAIVRETADTDLLRDALLENLHRSQLNPLEEAAAYDQLLRDFGCSHDELASRLGRSRPQISNTIRLLKLPPLVQRRVGAGVLSAGHARALLGLPDVAAMERLAQRIVAEGLSVRATEEIVALGGDAAPTRRRREPGAVDERLVVLADRLSDRFETRVKIVSGSRKGRLTVEFAGVEDLERILTVLAPDVELAGEGSGDPTSV